VCLVDIEDVGEYYFPNPSYEFSFDKLLCNWDIGYEREEIPDDADEPYRVGVDERDTFDDGNMDDIYSLDDHLFSDDD